MDSQKAQLKRDPSRRHLMDFLFALSLANLNLLMIWRFLLYASQPDRFLLPDYGAVDYLSALLLLTGLTLAVWAMVHLLRRLRNSLVQRLCGGFFLAVALYHPIENIRMTLGIGAGEMFGPFRELAAMRIPAAVFLISIFLIRYQLPGKAAFFAVVIFFPFAISNLLQCGWRLLVPADPRTAASLSAGIEQPLTRKAADSGTKRPRVVWIVFDELDYRVTFPERPSSIDLRSFDRLRSESFFATNVLEPGVSTVVSISALMLGKGVAETKPVGETVLMVKLEGTEKDLRFEEQENFFYEARQMALRSAIIGFHLPYCRLFAGSYDACYRVIGYPAERNWRSFPVVFAAHARKLIPLHSRSEFVDGVKRGIRLSRKLVADENLDLVYIHLPIPHPPFVYDHERGRFSIFSFGNSGYFDNLVLADQVLGEIRSAMEEAGIWEKTTLFVTADHGWRMSDFYDGKRDHRIPFILRLAGQREALTWDRPFDVLASKDLLLAIMEGRIRDPWEVGAWLQRVEEGGR